MENAEKNTSTISQHPLEISIGDVYSITIADADQINLVSKEYTYRTNKSIENNKILLEKDDSLVCRNILENIVDTLHLDEIFEILDNLDKYYGDIEIFSSYPISSTISRLINLQDCAYIWNELSSKPDYSLELFEKRNWPYNNNINKQYKNILRETKIEENEYKQAQSALKGYSEKSSSDKLKSSNPTITFENSNQNDDLNGFEEEISVSHHDNNFAAYAVLNPNEYDLDIPIRNIRLLRKMRLHKIGDALFVKYCLTPSTCHIIKHASAMDNILNLSHYVLIHAAYYAIYILRHESMVMFTQVHDNYRVIFTYDELLNLNPIIKTCIGPYVDINPFIQQLTGSINLAESMPFYCSMYREITDPITFSKRAKFMTGNALNNINLKDYNAAWVGSSLIPCIMECGLELYFKHKQVTYSNAYKTLKLKEKDCLKSNNDIDNQFITYTEYYYTSSISLQKDDLCKFIKPIQQEDDDEIPVRDDTDEEDNKKNKINKPGYNQMADIDIAIYTFSWDDFDEKSIKLINHIKENCQSQGNVYFEKVITASGYKYAGRGPGLLRPIEIFRIFKPHIRLVKGFHVPCVHMYFDGNISVVKSIKESLKMLIECAAALLGGANWYYKWFSCNKIPMDVILKYAQRGITTILNKSEKKALSKYMITSDRWNPLFKNTKTKIYGIVNDTHIFLHPHMQDFGIRYGLDNSDKKITSPYAIIDTTTRVLSNPNNRHPDFNLKTNMNINPPSSISSYV